MLIFNLHGNGMAEIKRAISFIYNSLKFSEIEPDIEEATELLIAKIGNEVYTEALEIYAEYPTEDADKDKFIVLMQRVIARFAYREFSANRDLTHDGNGRKMHHTDDAKVPFEHMLDRDDEAQLRKAYRAMDSLIAFLEENDELTKWKGSQKRQEMKSLFVYRLEDFEQFFPINNSRYTLLHLYPFLKEAQDTLIQPLMGERFAEYLNKVKDSAEISADENQVLYHIRRVMVLYSIAVGLERLPVSILPQGLISAYTGDRSTSKAKAVALPNDRASAADKIRVQMDRASRELSLFLDKIYPKTPPTPSDKPIVKLSNQNSKYVRL